MCRTPEPDPSSTSTRFPLAVSGTLAHTAGSRFCTHPVKAGREAFTGTYSRHSACRLLWDQNECNASSGKKQKKEYRARCQIGVADSHAVSATVKFGLSDSTA